MNISRTQVLSESMAMELLEQIEAYLVQTRVSPSTFGRLVVGDPRFVVDLRSGRNPRRQTCERVKQYLLAKGVVVTPKIETLSGSEGC